MIARFCAALVIVLGAATAIGGSAPDALAQPNGFRLEISPFAGAVVHDDNSPTEDDVLYGGRLGLWFNRFLGIEGTFNYNPTVTRQTPRDDIDVSGFGADLVVNLVPEGSAVVPYLTGGWANTRYDLEPAGGSTVTLDGFDFGGGLKFRLYEGSNSRVSFRMDVRDVVARDAEEIGSPESSLHNIFASGGISVAFGPGEDRDTDGDGIFDDLDACPGTPMGATVDARGCPLDGDQDGVYDGLDRCPGTVAGSIVDEFGCAVDTDGDGIADGLDQCPDTPANARVDKDGCPIDADGDGVPDGIDQCPHTPIGAMVDAEGCALDGDGDGVPDGIDECPNSPAGADVDPRGCPLSAQEKAFLDTGTLRLNDVNFASNSATLEPESYAALNEVGGMLQKWSKLEIEIGGHTDSQGAAEYNQKLSQARAQAVLDYLLENFAINSTQFSVKGYGESVPVADNATAEGRRANRRVEFTILTRGTIEEQLKDE